MKRLILHIGAHRTGTTAIQKMLVDNRVELVRRGVTPIVRRDLVASPWLAPLLALHRHPLGALACILGLRRLPGETLIVSEENILGLMPGLNPPGFYPNHARALRGLALLSRFFETSVRWVVRRQDRFLESAYAFRVSRGATEDFETYCARYARSLHWHPIARALASARYDLRIAPFEALVVGARERQLAEFLGLPTDGLWQRRLRVRNSSAQGALVNVVLYLVRAQPDLPWKQRGAISRALARFGRGPLPSCQEVREAIAESGASVALPLVQAAHAFAATAPRPELDAAARAALLQYYAEDQRALFAMRCVMGSVDDWKSLPRPS
jgi:hypothetical protein